MEVKVIEIGEITVNKATFPILFFALDLYDHCVLIDAGCSREQSLQLDSYKQWVSANITKDLETALSEHNIDIRKINDVILTHLHFDHACNLESFHSDTKFYVNKHEWEGLPRSRSSIDYQRQYLEGFQSSIILVEDGFDLYNNGQIKCIHTPGHSKGHQSVFVNTQDTTYLFTGDMFYTSDDFLNGSTSAHIFNQETFETSLHKLNAELMACLGQIVIYPAHDTQNIQFENYEEILERRAIYGHSL